VTAQPPGSDLDAEAPGVSESDLVTYTLRLADDALILAQRMGEWIAAAPQLEEDVALANIALDLLGQARSLLTYAGQVEGAGRDEDDLAYLREERDFHNAQLFELPNGDFAFTIARLLVASTFFRELYSALSGSRDATLAAIAAKAVKEVDYHRDHATQWTLRLGDGTDESHRRMEQGLAEVWPYVAELFESDDLSRRLDSAGIGVDPQALMCNAIGSIERTLVEATLELPRTNVRHRGGRSGVHTEHLGYLLAEMQYLHRLHPGATW
jgi:ring-1,2-phenylacetyl-CoA epoxidase subunit PaaC